MGPCWCGHVCGRFASPDRLRECRQLVISSSRGAAQGDRRTFGDRRKPGAALAPIAHGKHFNRTLRWRSRSSVGGVAASSLDC